MAGPSDQGKKLPALLEYITLWFYLSDNSLVVLPSFVMFHF